MTRSLLQRHFGAGQILRSTYQPLRECFYAACYKRLKDIQACKHPGDVRLLHDSIKPRLRGYAKIYQKQHPL